LSKFATLTGTSAAGRSHQEIALQAVEAARKPVDIDDFTRSRRKGVVLLAGNETGHASATNANAALTNNEDNSSMATQENSSASTNPQETTHTPGPWYFSGTDDDDEPTEGYVRSQGAGDELVAVVFAKQDVALISAAPDLLAALTELVEQVESYCESTGHKDKGSAMFGTCDAICAAIPAGRAAIAKAKGGAR